MEHNSAAPEFKKSGLIGSGGKQSPPPNIALINQYQ
jgi:hypothetical protein